MQSKIIILLLVILYSKTQLAQIKVGQWVDHLAFNSATSVAKVSSTVYVSNGQGLAKYNLDDNSIEKFTKIDGLSDVGAKLLRKCEANDNLIVIYSNSNIDVIKPNGTIINVSDVKRKNIIGNKTINEVYFKGTLAYLACGFGIIVFDTEKLEIKDTYHIGTSNINYNIYQVTSNDTAIFAATSKGVFYGKKSSNLSYYQNWKSLNNGIPSGPYNAIINFNGKIVANYSRLLKDNTNVADSLYQFDGTTWVDFPYKSHTPYPYTIKKLYDYTSQYGSLVLIDQWGVQDYNSNGTGNNYITSYAPNEYADVQDLYYVGPYQFWLADKNYGFLRSNGSGQGTKLPINGPAVNYANDIDVKDGNVIVAPVNLGETFTNQYNSSPGSIYNEGEWKSLRPLIPTNIQDINSVAIDPNNKDHYAFACMSSGVLEINNNQLVGAYTETNSPLVGYIGSTTLLVTNIGFDKNSNMWVMMTGSSKSAQIRKKDGTWKMLDFSQFFNGATMSKVIFTKNNQAWMILARGTGLLVYNDVNGLSTPNSSNTKFLSTAKGNGAMPSLDVYSICEDLDGRVWVGTQKGVTVFYNPENMFTGSNNWDSQQILIEQDGYVQILLQNDKITALAVDGANRKWIGTESSGVYCLSPDGQTEIHHFTKENSPLYSDNVNAIAIDDTKGDVFIGTDVGVQSYRTAFIKPFDDYSNLHIFPNPVRPGYSGSTYITGLVDETIVKITDVAGHLVWEGKSQGGQIEWNLQNSSGGRVASGVYLINCSTANGEKSGNAKLLVIN